MTQARESQRFDIDTEEKLAAWTGDIAAWNAWGAEHGGEGFEPLDPERPVHPVQKGDAAMALWRRGRKDWNAWVERNPKADVNFSGQHFGPNAKDHTSKPLIDFRSFRFPDGDVGFNSATFHKGNVSFNHATFGEGNVSFNSAHFGHGDVTFKYATFGEGDVNFSRATFGLGNVKFSHATFGEGNINFYGVRFDEGDVSFNSATFGDGDVSFTRATFDEGDVCFDEARFGKGDVSFTGASFGRGAISFGRLAFEGVARFDYLDKLERCTQFSFEGCSFDKLFIFSHEGRMGCPLDLRRTKLAHGVVLNDVKCDYAKEFLSDWTARGFHRVFAWPNGFLPAWPWRKRAADPQDSQRFRRLKELAQNENNRAKALEFNAQELRSQRGHESHPLQDFLQIFYMLLSDYGRSVVRPLVGLGVVTGVFGLIYASLATKLAFAKAWPAAITYSGGNMFAFVPIGRSALEQSRADLFGDTIPYELLWIGGYQSVLSVILLFLLGLGLRNMFRL